ncbi:hypothetical protein J2X68_002769 [Streptomyces sp. 3330]|uniref:arabinofuranosidase catalytic domain-containing protein n=1 Tax=Streptomyces sp. 3330 TaxID=2817755 RepID=UPI002858DA4E|nr:arabinofuranosidase catalytic domain-containing protein [Streptomyces sp. 3330]MDR6976081.1 hypothetical protein [Streptomyces sp. 3330]
MRKLFTRVPRRGIGVTSAAALAIAVSNLVASPASAAAQGPCDIYAAGGTPCVAAHSMTRALYASYDGWLYQVRRSSDNTTLDVGLSSVGGLANSAAQDAFCAGTGCAVTTIYDQSGRHNNLNSAPTGYWPGPGPNGTDLLSSATAAPVMVGGKKVYGIQIGVGAGYRNNATNGVATGDEPEGMYAIFDGRYSNGKCCFDYGNAETTGNDDGNGTMEALYFGSNRSWGSGAGNGPWIMADLENGLFSGQARGYNAGDPSQRSRFVTATLKGGPNQWAIRGGDAQSGGLSTYYSGPRPTDAGYNPMTKQGAIILGIGGDNSSAGVGTFYEGVMTSGYPSDATENSVQADITAAGYAPYVVPAPYYKLVNRNSGKVLGVTAGSFGEGTNAVQWSDTDAVDQRWHLAATGDYDTLVNKNSALNLGVYAASTSNGAAAVQWSENGSYDQQWSLVPTGSYYKLVNRRSGKVLGVGSGSTADGAQVVQWTDTGALDQQWSLVAAS